MKCKYCNSIQFRMTANENEVECVYCIRCGTEYKFKKGEKNGRT